MYCLFPDELLLFFFSYVIDFICSCFFYRLHVATKYTPVGFVMMNKRRIQWIGRKSPNWYVSFATLVNLSKLLVRIAIVNLASIRAWSAIFLTTRIKTSTTAMDVEFAESVAVTSSFIVPSATCACQFNYKMGIR